MCIKEKLIHTALGDGMIDKAGAAVAVARMDVKKSYKGTGPLLQKVINISDILLNNPVPEFKNAVGQPL